MSHGHPGQWPNSVGEGRGAEPGSILFTGRFLVTYREKREARKNGEEKKENCKRKVENSKWKGEVLYENEDCRGLFFPF